MAGKKKKRTTANPARGVATTSIASKPKPETEGLLADEPDVVAEDPVPSNENLKPTSDQPSPGELEAQLEHDELQMVVEKYASKAQRESRRQLSKIEAEQRMLRSQAQPFSTRSSMPEDLLNRIVDLARAELWDTRRPLLTDLPEDEATLRLWTLELVLRALEFTRENTQLLFRWICACSAQIDPSPPTWGLQESLEYFALQGIPNALVDYEERVKRLAAGRFRSVELGTKPLFEFPKFCIHCLGAF